MKNLPILTGLLLLVVFGCSRGPQPINYGTDLCSMCRMKIMDNKFGTEVVTTKGKVFKFDSDECLLGYLNTGILKEESVANVLVTDYMNPGTFIDGKQAFFLYCENVPSPMGGNISAFKNREEAQKLLNEKGGQGEIQTWKGIREFRKTH